MKIDNYIRKLRKKVINNCHNKDKKTYFVENIKKCKQNIIVDFKMKQKEMIPSTPQ